MVFIRLGHIDAFNHVVNIRHRVIASSHYITFSVRVCYYGCSHFVIKSTVLRISTTVFCPVCCQDVMSSYTTVMTITGPGSRPFSHRVSEGRVTHTFKIVGLSINQWLPCPLAIWIVSTWVLYLAKSSVKDPLPTKPSSCPPCCTRPKPSRGNHLAGRRRTYSKMTLCDGRLTTYYAIKYNA